jgi:hypothetical protein
LVGQSKVWNINGRELCASWNAIERAGPRETVRGLKPRLPLHLRIFPDRVEIQKDDGAPAVLTGNPAGIVRVVAEKTRGQQPAGVSVHWTEVADEVLGLHRAESSWSVNLSRLRQALASRGVYRYLVRNDHGRLRLDLRDGVDDLTLLSAR